MVQGETKSFQEQTALLCHHREQASINMFVYIACWDHVKLRNQHFKQNCDTTRCMTTSNVRNKKKYI